MRTVAPVAVLVAVEYFVVAAAAAAAAAAAVVVVVVVVVLIVPEHQKVLDLEDAEEQDEVVQRVAGEEDSWAGNSNVRD